LGPEARGVRVAVAAEIEGADSLFLAAFV
jgi:hypothetical protein